MEEMKMLKHLGCVRVGTYLMPYLCLPRPLPHPAWHSILAVGSDAAVVNPAGIRIMRAGIDDRDLAGLPIRDVDQQLGAP